MPDSNNSRDPNEIMKTLLTVIDEYEGFVMGLDGANSFYTFSSGDSSSEGSKLLDEDIEAQNITNLRRSFFATLLDTAIGAYYTADIAAGKGIFTSNSSKVADLSKLDDYIKILADTSVQLAKANFPPGVILRNSDSKTPNKGVASSLPASMRYMTREFVNRRTRIIDGIIKDKDLPEGTLISPRAQSVEGGDRVVTYVDEYTAKEREAYLEEFDVPSPIETMIVNKEGRMEPPSLTDKKMAAYVIKDSEFNFSKRRVEFLSLFFNAITPVEMSRCTPYIEITFYHQNFGTHEQNFLNPAGYMKFFSNETNENGRQKLQGFAGKTYPFNEKPSNLYDTDIGYMNMFTAPQTMVNANINSEPGSWRLGDIKTNSYNSALEPFAPQATLKNLVLSTVSGGYGFTSKKKGTMAITIHDRSRLKHFAPLISVNQLAKSSMKVSFGWSHPDGSVSSDNPIGRFLDSMKSTQMYTLISSNLRFQGNSVEADLEIVSLGNQHIDDVSAAAGAHIPLRSIAPAIESIVRSLITKEKNKINKTQSEEIAYVHPQLELLIQTANSVETMVSSADYETLLELIKGNDGGDLDKWVIIAIANMLGVKTLGEGFEVLKKRLKEESKKEDLDEASSNAEIASNTSKRLKLNTGKILRAKYNTLFAQQNSALIQPDYFTEGCLVREAIPSSSGIHKNPEFVSLGKIISNFVAAPLIATSEYSEVQMFFYPLNSAAGGARIYTTASLPFKKSELDAIFERTPKDDEEIDEDEESIKLGTISAKVMFAKIAALTNSSDFEAYGLSEVGTTARKAKGITLLETAQKDKKKEEEVINAYFSKFGDKGKDDYNTTKIKEKKEAVLKAAVDQYIAESFSERKQELLNEIYASDGLGATDTKTFRFPALNMHLEVVEPIQPVGEGDIPLDIAIFGAEGAVYDKTTQTEYGRGRILRIHIVDETNIGTPKVDLANQILYTGKKDPSQNQVTAGILAKGISSLSDAELKEYIKRHYATIIYGAGSSTVKSVNLSSSTSDRIAQAKMMTFEKNRRSNSVSKNVNTIGESIRMLPASIDLQMLGCPLVERGSIIFIDMGTNTDLDNCYVVNSVTHTISSGDFTTSLGLVVGNQGTIINARGNLLQKLNAIASPLEELKTDEPPLKLVGDINHGPSKYRAGK